MEEKQKPGQLHWIMAGPDLGIWLKCGCGAFVPPGSPRKKGLVHVNGRICFGFCHSYTYGGSRVPLSWSSPSGRGVEVDAAQVGTPEGKEVTQSLLRNQFLRSFPCHLFAFPISCDKLIFHGNREGESSETACVEHVV